MNEVSNLISVALCTYNGARFIDEQLASVLAQRDVSIEVVICDDQSTDDTWIRLESWAKRDSRVRLVRNKERLGYTHNFAHAISLCRGEFIAPCDQDDIWLPEKLNLLVAAINGHLMAYCDSLLVDEQGVSMNKRVSDRLKMYQGSGVLPFCFWNCISGHAMLFRRSLIPDCLPIPVGCFHDWWLAAVAASRGSIAYLAEPLVHYRQHTGSQTDINRQRKARRDSWKLYHDRQRWLQALAEVPGLDQHFCKKLSALWTARSRQWLCPSLVMLLASRASEIMRINRRESFARFAFKQLIGQRWRRLT